MRVSVVIPTYNVEEYIAETLESVLAQSRPPDEIIVVDDASTDATREVVRRYPVTLLEQAENRGSCAARNRAIQAASGDVIATIDGDDLWAPDHLGVLTGMLERHPEAVAAGSAIRLFGLENFDLVPRFAPGGPRDVFVDAFEHCVVWHMAVAYRREVAIAAGLYYEPERYAEDMYLWMRMSRSGPFVCTHQVTAFYRKHENQVSSVPHRQRMARMRHRRRMVDALSTAGEVELAAAMRKRLGAIWRRDLRLALQSRDAGSVRALLAVRDAIPEVRWFEPPLWSVAARLIPAVERSWDRRPPLLRRARQ